MAKSLYICYFGMREPLVQTQVIPYLRELTKGGHEISLLTFEPTPLDAAGVDAGRDACGPGIEWHWLKYHKRFSAVATAWDILAGTWFVWRFVGRERPDILHGRVHVPTLMGALARKFSRTKPKLLFDIRGFFPEEYTDAGIWPENGLLYRAAKRIERWLMKEADGFVVLTEKARAILFPESGGTGYDKHGRPVEVIPCCVDFARLDQVGERSRLDVRERLGISERHVIAYVGSFGGWYLTGEMMKFFAFARRRDPKSFALILTQRNKESVRQMFLGNGFTSSDFLVEAVAPNEVGEYLSAADLSISFIKACYSKQSSSPTKIAEYLASSLPVVANTGVGDIDDLLIKNEVGAILEGFAEIDFANALHLMEDANGMRERCRNTAELYFDLMTVGGERYRRIYSRLIKKRCAF